jgi:hypothetical protein
MIDSRLLMFVGKRWALRFLLLSLAVTPVAAQTITFHGVPPNATVQCISNAPATLLAVSGPIPFGVASGVLSGKVTGSFFDITSTDVGSGKDGKLNLNDELGTAAWLADMTTNGCGCTVPVGSVPTITGNAGVQQAFQSMGLGDILIIPVVDQFNTSTSQPANIIGFIVAELVIFSTTGSHWDATFVLLSGPPSAPNVTATSSCGAITNLVFHETLPNGNTNVIIRTWTAFDSCGNSATATQLVTVVNIQPLVINCPGNIVTNTTGTNGVIVTFGASATDTCGGIVALGCTPASGSTFGVGITPVNCTAADSVGNQANCAFYVAVVSPLMFQINSVAALGNDLLLTWNMPHGCTGIVQATSGDTDGSYSNTFSDISAPIFVAGNSFFTTNYLDYGATTNSPSRFYRIHLVIPYGLVP